MTKKTWVILGILVAVLGAGVLMVALCVFFFFWGENPIDYRLPVYSMDQVDSSHPGYRRTTITSGNNVFICDYDEYPIQSESMDLSLAIGRTPVAGGKFCAIPGQTSTNYVVEVGCMGPEGVYRNSRIPPFDWRNANFQKMRLAVDYGPAAQKISTDPAVINEVVQILKSGTPIPTPAFAGGSYSNVHGICLYSDQLPGLIFQPAMYIDSTGQVFLAESYVVNSATSTLWKSARWITASPAFTKWTQTR